MGSFAAVNEGPYATLGRHSRRVSRIGARRRGGALAADVSRVDRLAAAGRRERGRVTIIDGDIRDRKLVDVVARGIDVVFHQAALRVTQVRRRSRARVRRWKLIDSFKSMDEILVDNRPN